MSSPTTPQSFRSSVNPRNNFDTELWNDLANVVYATDDPNGDLVVKMPVTGRLQIWVMVNISNAGAGGTVFIAVDGVNLTVGAASSNDDTVTLVQYVDLTPGVYTLTLDSTATMTSGIITARRGRIPSTV